VLDRCSRLSDADWTELEARLEVRRELIPYLLSGDARPACSFRLLSRARWGRSLAHDKQPGRSSENHSGKDFASAEPEISNEVWAAFSTENRILPD